MKATEFLDKASASLSGNAKLRDMPDGERSAPRAAAILRAWTGREWREADVWRCLLAVKLAREQQGQFHFDDYVDVAGYAGLLGECESRFAEESPNTGVPDVGEEVNLGWPIPGEMVECIGHPSDPYMKRLRPIGG